MKKYFFVLLALTSISALAVEGTISIFTATNRDNALDLTINGLAAKAISKQLMDNGASFRRDPFSGALVQLGDGVRCIDQDGVKAFYCYISITGKAVN